jgi:hypothetical protein
VLVQIEMSRSEFRRRVSALIKEGHGSGFNALLLRWEFSRRSFFKKETKFSPAVLYSNTLWLKPAKQSELDFLVALLRHMGEGTEALSYLGNLHHIEQKRHAEMQSQLMGAFQSVRLTKPVEAVAASISKRSIFMVTS